MLPKPVWIGYEPPEHDDGGLSAFDEHGHADVFWRPSPHPTVIITLAQGRLPHGRQSDLLPASDIGQTFGGIARLSHTENQGVPGQGGVESFSQPRTECQTNVGHSSSSLLLPEATRAEGGGLGLQGGGRRAPEPITRRLHRVPIGQRPPFSAGLIDTRFVEMERAHPTPWGHAILTGYTSLSTALLGSPVIEINPHLDLSVHPSGRKQRHEVRRHFRHHDHQPEPNQRSEEHTFKTVHGTHPLRDSTPRDLESGRSVDTTTALPRVTNPPSFLLARPQSFDILPSTFADS